MPVIDAPEGMPRGVSTLDLQSLELLKSQFVDMHSNDVSVIRGESIEARIGVAEGLIEKVAYSLGGVAAEKGLVIGIATVDSYEDVLLHEARRTQSPQKRLY
jgi:hypothetical protein